MDSWVAEDIFLPSSNITVQLHALAHTEDVPWLAE
jgi:hypothetical protein